MRTVLLDGGLATELEARGHDLDDPLWSARLLIEDPGAIADVHADYLAAGAEIVIGASYQASLGGLAARGLSADEAAGVLRRSVELARAACDEAGHGRVAASVGPYGAALTGGAEYTGAYDTDRAGLRSFHAERMRILVDAAPDLLACETIPSIEEVEVLAELLTVPAWIAVSCRDDRHLCDGTPIEALAPRVAGHPTLIAVGVNCTAPQHVESLLRRLATVVDLPLVAYPNSGERYDAASRRWQGTADPGDFAAAALRWQAAGARYIGGCCRTGPAHVRRLRAVLTG